MAGTLDSLVKLGVGDASCVEDSSILKWGERLRLTTVVAAARINPAPLAHFNACLMDMLKACFQNVPITASPSRCRTSPCKECHPHGCIPAVQGTRCCSW